MLSFRVLLSVLFFPVLAPVQAEILVYRSSVNRWSSYFINDGTKTPWVTAPRGTKVDAYLLYDLDGTNKILPANLMTYRGQTFVPYIIIVDHKLKTKQLKGGTQANEENNNVQGFYGRSRGPGGQRIFRILHHQWEPNSDGTHDASVGVADGACQILSVGGGKSGYYAPKILGQTWRLDGTFSGSIGSFQDGMQLKYLSTSEDLDLVTTQAINDNSLTLSQAFAYLIQAIFPSYTELPPQIVDD